MDALDESSEREILLKTVTQELISFDNVNILVTSRKERDIEEWLDDAADAKVSLEGQKIGNDIRLHVQKCLENDKRLKKWPSNLKQEIQDTLVQQADGM